jgi:MFS family permease
MNAMGITFGYAMASYMGLAFYYAHSPAAQWRGPLGIALIFPVLMLLVIFIVPESPRWLLMVGQEEKARDIVMKLHHVSNDPDQEYARSEFYQMQKQTEFDKTLNPTWKQMFMKPSYRKRAVIACAFAFIGQSTAVLVINNYGPTVYKALGYNTLDQLILQCGWITVAIPSNFLGLYPIYMLDKKLIPVERRMYHGPNRPKTTYADWCHRLLRLPNPRGRHGRLLRFASPALPSQ